MEKYELPFKQYRVLFSNGAIFDCLSQHLDSDFREWVMAKNGITKKSDISILGIAEVKEDEA